MGEMTQAGPARAVLSRAQREQIHAAALQILAAVGIRTDHAGLRARLAEAGGTVSGERVRLPAGLIEQALAATPGEFSLYGRSTEDAPVVIRANGPTFGANTGILPNIYDLDTGVIRRSTLADVSATTRVLDALDQVHLVYVSLVDATDVPPHTATVEVTAATIANTTKPMLGPGLINGAEARAVIAMYRALRGDAEALRRYPPCVPFICPISPLQFPAEIVEAQMAVAEAGLPLLVVTNPVMGVTAPYTLAGTLALGHAEVLATAAINYVLAPGLPLLANNTPSIADMRSLASTAGGPECGLLRRAGAELLAALNIPSFVHGHTSSTRLDYQAGDEKALNTFLIADGRPAVLGGLGALSNVTLASYETLVLDNERYAAIARVEQGIAVDDEHLGLDALAALVAGGDLLGHPHTLRHLRSGEVWRPALSVRQGLVGGRPPAETSLERARASARRLVATHQVPALPASVQAEMEAIRAAYGSQ